MTAPAEVERSAFGATPDGRAVSLFEIRSGRGIVLKMIDYGATVLSLETPDRSGRLANITLGFPSLAGFLEQAPYFGSTIGRTCNRIAESRFALDGTTFVLDANDGPHHLHGGSSGFGRRLWQSTPFADSRSAGVEFRYVSPDGEAGYPGRVDATARYSLSDRDELVIAFTATCDRATPVDLTNHCYWNLCGAGTGTIRDHVLELACDHYLPVDAGLIPTGEIVRVAGTAMDFRRPRAIGARLDEVGGAPVGYDHCHPVRGDPGSLRFAARVEEPQSGRVMEIHTTQPALQFYSGNSLDGSPRAGGHAQWSGFCLEAQHYPDSVNRLEFPSTILRPGETYRQLTVHRFVQR